MTLRKLVPWGEGGKNLPASRDMESPFGLLHREMNRLFDFFSRDLLSEAGGSDVFELGGYVPRVNVSETDSAVEITADLPGLEDKDIEVSLSDDAVTIRGQKSEEKEDKGKNFYRLERSYGSFHRVIPLPAEIDAAKAEASYKKGVLRLTLPKAETQKKSAKKIPVKGE